VLDLDFGTYPYVTSSNPSVGSTCTGLGVPPRDIHGVAGVVKVLHYNSHFCSPWTVISPPNTIQAYCTRVGEGPFPTELQGAAGGELREKGGEYGTTTGRPRRCGWIDIPQLKYSIMVSALCTVSTGMRNRVVKRGCVCVCKQQVNGIDSINLTKLDVLTGFQEVKIGARYQDASGQEVGHMPSSLSQFSQVRVDYETLPGWTEDISHCQSFEELPANCQAYVKRLEELLGVPIGWVGVGNARSDMIKKGDTSVFDSTSGAQK
jgi:adenylosuccinate synthase